MENPRITIHLREFEPENFELVSFSANGTELFEAAEGIIYSAASVNVVLDVMTSGSMGSGNTETQTVSTSNPNVTVKPLEDSDARNIFLD